MKSTEVSKEKEGIPKMSMIESFLSNPAQVFGQLKNAQDPKKLIMGLFMSDASDPYIEELFGVEAKSFKQNIAAAFSGPPSKKAMAKAREKSTAEKIQAYRNLAGELINKHKLSEFEAIVLASGLFNIDLNGICEYLRSRGWDANPPAVANYYKKREPWFKKFMAKIAPPIEGWNDNIESFDFSPVGAGTKPSPTELKPIPDPEVDPEVPEMVPPSTTEVSPESLNIGVQ